MNTYFLIFFTLVLILTGSTYANTLDHLFPSLDSKKFTLIESNRLDKEFEKELDLTIVKSKSHIRLQSSLSGIWQLGIFFDRNSKDVTIPTVGIGKLSLSKNIYTWRSQDEMGNISKKSYISIVPSQGQCILEWSFLVIYKLETQVQETGKIVYPCSKTSLGVLPLRTEN